MKKATLIFLNPPQLKARGNNGLTPKNYPNYILETLESLKDNFNTNASIVIRLNNRYFKGQSSIHSYKTILLLKENGYNLICDFLWHKTSCPPLGSNLGLANIYEKFYWFSKSPAPKCFPRNVPNLKQARASNIIEVSANTSKGNDLPVEIYRFFVTLLSEENDVVLDVFSSSSLKEVAEETGRLYLSI